MGGKSDSARVATGYAILSAPVAELPGGQGVEGEFAVTASEEHVSAYLRVGRIAPKALGEAPAQSQKTCANCLRLTATRRYVSPTATRASGICVAIPV